MSFIRVRMVAVHSVALLLASTMIAAAQGPERGRGFGGGGGLGGPGGGFGPGPGFAGPGFRFGGGRVVTNEPYSGTRVTTFAQVLSGGNSITRTNCSVIYRDSQGRTRQEETPNSSTCSSTPANIFIRDPVAGVEYFINTKSNTYRQFSFKAPPAASTPPNRPRGPNSGEFQTTLLPSKTVPVSGTATSLPVDGTQTTRTIPAGQIGNAQPIVITTTTWYAPDLQVVVSSERDDPRTGKAISQLSNIVLGEPSVSFQPPSGSNLRQGPGGRTRPGR